jgi:hypothetical protein
MQFVEVLESRFETGFLAKGYCGGKKREILYLQSKTRGKAERAKHDVERKRKRKKRCVTGVTCVTKR